MAKSVSLIIIVVLVTCCLILIWNIVGSIWIYVAGATDDGEEIYCNHTAYTLAYTMGRRYMNFALKLEIKSNVPFSL